MNVMDVYPTTLQRATKNHKRFRLVVFQRALGEAQEAGIRDTNKARLDSRYRLTTTQKFNDLNIYLYESS